MATPHPLIERLVDVCAQRRLQDWIIAPGSRSAPITVALANHPAMRCRLVFDERSAGYIALGLAQQRRQAVGLVCTSGTAAVNFGPAVVEAFYQGIPLLVLTADRPPEWIDQQDNQAIHQDNLFTPHVRAAFTFPINDGAGDTDWYANRIIANAIDIAQGWEPGPVHINVPLREPLYAGPAQPGTPVRARPAQQALAAQPRLDEQVWPGLLADWQAASRKLIVAGLHPADAMLRQALSTLAADPTVAIFADVTANLHGLANAPTHADSALAVRDPAALTALEPDLVVAFGGQVTSKALKSLLRAKPPKALWHVYPGRVAPDTYQALTHALPMQPAAFFAELAARAPASAPPNGSACYQAGWRAQSAVAAAALAVGLATAPFGELSAAEQVLAALPAGSRLQVGNSMPIRYVNLIGLKPDHLPAQVNGNRGTSGIDGTVSTAVGAAMADDTLTTLLVGDLGFFYDRNGLWHRHLPANLRIVVFNNHGGGIFDIIEGPNKLPRQQQETWFLTPQPLRAERTAADHGLRYFFAGSGAALATALPAFFAPAATPALLEIESDLETNSRVFAQIKSLLAQQPAAEL